MDAFKGLKIGGGSASSTPTNTGDNLFSTDTVEVVLGLSEGMIGGLVDGAKTFYAGGTPLVDNSGQPNIANFELKVHKGAHPGEPIWPNLGGTGASTEVGVALEEYGQSVVRSGSHTGVDFIDVRIAINRLLYVKENGGDMNNTGGFYIQVKRQSASWDDPYTPGNRLTTSDSAALQTVQGLGPDRVINSAFQEIYAQYDPPVAKANNAFWFFLGGFQAQPYVWYNGNWLTPTNLTYTVTGGLSHWQWIDQNSVHRNMYYSEGGSPPSFPIGRYDFFVTPSGATENADGVDSYVWNGSAWVDSIAWAGPLATDPGYIQITGHVSSTVVKDYRINVPRIDEPYDIRVTRASIKNDTHYFFDMTFESFQEMTTAPQVFDDLAVAHLTIRASDSFSSLPEFTGDYYGRIIRIPSNYDPVNRIYYGIWDGTFVFAYTDNPAWIVYDLVMNTRYGMNAYYPITLDKYDVYEFSKHCDRYGFTYNDYIQEPRNLKEMCDYIVGIAGGRFVDRMDGFATILFDADEQPATALFTAENVVDGLFTYSFTDITERKNDFSVSFINPDLEWREDRVRVYSQTDINAYGQNPEDFIAVGCISETEAVKRGRLRLVTSVTEKTIVSFKTNRQGKYLLPYSVILVADDDLGQGITGRVKSFTPGDNKLYLRENVYLEPGIPYIIYFQVPTGGDEFGIITYSINSTLSSGTTDVLYLNQSIANLAEKPTFTIGRADGGIAPKPYRIVGIEEVDGDPDNISISALEVNRQKWAYVNGEVPLRDVISYQSGNPTSFILPPTDPEVIAQTTLDGYHNLLVRWKASQSPVIRSYRVYLSTNNGPREVVGEPIDTQLSVNGVFPGIYRFDIVAVGLDGRESPQVSIAHYVGGYIRTIIPPSNLRLVDEPDEGYFTTISPIFAWDPSPSPFISGYVIQILDPVTDEVIRVEDTDQITYQYTFEKNITDNGGAPNRSIKVSVKAKDMDGYLSDDVRYAATNVPPQVIPFSVTNTTVSLQVEYDFPSERDFRGVLIWMSTEDGFDPLVHPETLMYDGSNTQAFLTGDYNTLYYIRMAGYDAFSKDPAGLNISGQLTGYITSTVLDVFPPDTPTGLTLSTASSVDSYGDVSSSLTASWSVNTSENFSHFEVDIREGTGTYITYLVGTSTTITVPRLTPGVTYYVRVRAISKSGIASGYSTVKNITAALNTTPPLPASNLNNTAGFQTASLTWTNPSNKDIKWIEVWEGTTNLIGGATLIATTTNNWYIRSGIPTGAVRYYWVRPVNTSDITAAIFTGPTAFTSPTIQAAALANNIIDSTKMATGLEVPTVVSALPNPIGYGGSKLVVLTSDGKLYRYFNGQWTSAIPAADISGQIVSTQITDNSVTTDKILANSITGAKIVAGAIGVTQLAAGAVTADKIGVGLGTSNILFDSDCLFEDATYFQFTNNLTGGGATTFAKTTNPLYIPPGMGAMQMSVIGTPTGSMSILPARVNLDGTTSSLLPAVSGKRYEFSAYVSAHRGTATTFINFFNSSGSIIATDTTGRLGTVTNNQTSGPLSNWNRVGQISGQAPDTTAYVQFRIQFDTFTGSDPYLYLSGLYAGQATPNQAQLSDWAHPNNTIIDGGSIVTGTITARTIAAGTITADNIAAGTITAAQIAAGTITTDKLAALSISASNILISGTTTLADWRSGGDNTKIEGGSIAANTITANKIKIGARGLTTTGIDFSVVKETGVISWSAGSILYINSAGIPTSKSIPAGSVNTTGNWTYVYWTYGASNLSYGLDWTTIMSNPDNLIIAQYSGWAGLTVSYGGSIIDGSRIVTGTIQAAQIAAGAIQSDKIGANQIVAGHIAAGQITADKIGAGTINANYILIGNDRFYFENNSNQPRMMIRDWSNVPRVVIGNLAPWLTDQWYGLLLYDASGNLQFSSNAGLNGGYVWTNSLHANKIIAGSITADKIAAGTITADKITTGVLIASSAQIGDLVVGTTNVANNAISQVVSSGANYGYAGASIYVRNPNSTVMITAFAYNNMAQPRGNVSSPTLLIKWYPGGSPGPGEQIVGSAGGNGYDDTRGNYHWGSTSLQVTLQPGVGWHSFFMQYDPGPWTPDTSAIYITELTK